MAHIPDVIAALNARDKGAVSPIRRGLSKGLQSRSQLLRMESMESVKGGMMKRAAEIAKDG